MFYHPFEPVLERAEGIYLYDTEGNRYIDASSGPMAVGLGHGDRRVLDAMTRQMEKFTYCHPTLSSQPRAELCERIGQMAPGNLNTTFLVPGGSEATDTAIKLARQYHVERGDARKHIVVSRWESYHGVTLGALSTGGYAGNRDKFMPMLFQWPHIRQPSDYGRPPRMSFTDYSVQCTQELEEAIYYAGPDNVSAFIATPIGSGEEYGLLPPVEYWKLIRAICDRYNVLLIADEIVTGFGRTGKRFGMDHFDVQPDIMLTAKGISSEYAPVGAVTVSDEVNEPFRDGGAEFGHGFTNGGHPLACAAALAVLDVLEADGLVENSAQVGAYLHSQRNRLLRHPTIADVRGVGMFMVPEVVSNRETMEFFPEEADAERRLLGIALKNGLALYATLSGPGRYHYGTYDRPENHKRGLPMYIAPPLCTTRAQVDELMDALDATLTEWERAMGVA